MNETDKLVHLFREAPHATDAVTMVGQLDPKIYVQTCKEALWNWGLRHIHGIEVPNPTGQGWKTNEDALQAWNKALKYWESKCNDQG